MQPAAPPAAESTSAVPAASATPGDDDGDAHGEKDGSAAGGDGTSSEGDNSVAPPPVPLGGRNDGRMPSPVAVGEAVQRWDAEEQQSQVQEREREQELQPQALDEDFPSFEADPADLDGG